MPSDIPYNFRQSSSRGDTITSPMIYDQSLPKEGKEKRRSTNNDCGAASIKRRAQPGESHFMVITPGDPLIIWKALKRKWNQPAVQRGEKSARRRGEEGRDENSASPRGESDEGWWIGSRRSNRQRS